MTFELCVEKGKGVSLGMKSQTYLKESNLLQDRNRLLILGQTSV
jgi:hypothetical protein